MVGDDDDEAPPVDAAAVVVAVVDVAIVGADGGVGAVAAAGIGDAMV